MKVTYKNRMIKLIPRKYKAIENITDHLEDFDHLRLTEDERETLDYALFAQEAAKFIEELKEKEKLVYEICCNTKPASTVKVITSDDQVYYALRMSNNLSIRCDEALYRLSPIRNKITYTNSLSRQIAPPPVEQLRMF